MNPIVPKIDLTTIPHYLEGVLIGAFNQLEHLWLRTKIAEENLEGYYLEWNGRLIHIDNNGELNENPSQMYSEMSNAWTELLIVRQVKQNKQHRLFTTID